MTPEEYNDCVERYSDDLYRFAVHCCGDEERGKDVVQEAFVSLWEQRKKVESERAKSFLFMVLRRRMTDMWRHEQVANDVHRQLASLSINDWGSTARFEASDFVNQLLDLLPPLWRAIVMLHDIEGYAHGEIAKIMNLNYKQVQVYLFRARVAMKKYACFLEKNNINDEYQSE